MTMGKDKSSNKVSDYIQFLEYAKSVSKEDIKNLKTVNTYSSLLAHYETIKEDRVHGLDDVVNRFKKLIGEKRKKENQTHPEEVLTLVLESVFFKSYYKCIGDHCLSTLSNEIIETSDFQKLGECYRTLMEMDLVNDDYGADLFNQSIVEKRKKDIPVLQDSIFKQMEIESKQEQPSKEEKPVEQYQHIFCNNGFGLFEYLLFNCTNAGKGHHSDIIYYYHRMKRDNFIHQPQQTFLNWYFEYTNNVHYIQNKPIHQVNSSNREMHYSNACSWFKQQK